MIKIEDLNGIYDECVTDEQRWAVFGDIAICQRLDLVLVALEKLDRPLMQVVDHDAPGSFARAMTGGPLPKIKRTLHVLAKDYGDARDAIIRLGVFAAGEGFVMDGNRWVYVNAADKLMGLNKVEIMKVPGFGEHEDRDEIVLQLRAIRVHGDNAVTEQECP